LFHRNFGGNLSNFLYLSLLYPNDYFFHVFFIA